MAKQGGVASEKMELRKPGRRCRGAGGGIDNVVCETFFTRPPQKKTKQNSEETECRTAIQASLRTFPASVTAMVMCSYTRQQRFPLASLVRRSLRYLHQTTKCTAKSIYIKRGRVRASTATASLVINQNLTGHFCLIPVLSMKKTTKRFFFVPTDVLRRA